ncbi:MAG: hypothetical protein M5U28_06240 [Sandaracinaceae bacterium]|nr:hypothetical protein [Sandaracinaceae bacterium]
MASAASCGSTPRSGTSSAAPSTSAITAATCGRSVFQGRSARTTPESSRAPQASAMAAGYSKRSRSRAGASTALTSVPSTPPSATHA